MAYPADKIIQVNSRISAAGKANANFASAMLFAAPGEIGELEPDKFKSYFTLPDVAVDFPEDTETYKSAARWLGGIPTLREIEVWVTDPDDTSYTVTLNKARNIKWWYWSLFTDGVYAVKDTVKEIAKWCEDNASMFVNNQTGEAAAKIRDQNVEDDIASELTLAGFRHAYTAVHATDAYAGTALAKHFAIVNYSADRSTITGEFKKSPGVIAEDLTGSEIAAMEMDTKKAVFYSLVELQGSTDVGRWLNTWTHSAYGEYIDDVVNLDAFINAITVALYNSMGGATTKLEQTPRDQAVLIAAARRVGSQFVSNGYLGPRMYVDPDDGEEKYTIGFEILTKPEDILYISDSDRSKRLSAPIRMRLFRAGAIHKAIVDLDIF